MLTIFRRKTNDLNLNAMNIGLNINKKTKSMQFVPSPPQITLENEILEEVDEFSYLGSKISKSNANKKRHYKQITIGQIVHFTN